MNGTVAPYCIFPLGDSALTIDFGNKIDEMSNQEVIARFNRLIDKPIAGMKEAVPAYSSLTIYYDPLSFKTQATNTNTLFEEMRSRVEQWLEEPVSILEQEQRKIRIPVCYAEEFAPDSAAVAADKKISVEELIQLHSSRSYRVYMLGFLPGFAYMGEVDKKIITNRKSQPAHTLAGSIGLAGKQTGIYPLDSPGGWNIIGQTPLRLFNPDARDPVLLQAGDEVIFYPISPEEFQQTRSEEYNISHGSDSH
jgi:inhibitor of KinA